MKREFVAAAYIVSNGRILLVKHRKLGLWLPPGGHIEEGELPDEAVKREVREETGLEVEILGAGDSSGSEKRVSVLATPHHMQLEDIDATHHHIDLVYVCRVVGGNHSANMDETEGSKWFSEKELDSPGINENVRHFGKKILGEFRT
ncbi:MAG: NUDIX domain-containing protein [Candidatus Micrarchaeota archaeon]|nr:NUDIX domain-containing protein [Candidatus Micrarchaeota archaeon]